MSAGVVVGSFLSSSVVTLATVVGVDSSFWNGVFVSTIGTSLSTSWSLALSTGPSIGALRTKNPSLDSSAVTSDALEFAGNEYVWKNWLA